jgi:CRP-like cAMP-binding protein
MKTIEDLMKAHPFFNGLDPKYISLIAGCGKNMVFQKGEFVAKEGEAANHFFIIKQGRVAIDILTVETGPVIIQTVQAGDIFGWSWIIEPHYWRFDARAAETTRVIALDGKCLRGKCEKDPKLGYELLKRFSSVLADRLETARFQLMDIYGKKTK